MSLTAKTVRGWAKMADERGAILEMTRYEDMAATIEDMERHWRLATRQISDGLSRHGLLLMIDTDGNYDIKRKD